MSQIIVGYDGSVGARAALTWAAEEAGLRRASVLVLCVQDEPTGGLPAARTGGIAPGGDAEEVAADILDGQLHDVRRERGHPAERLVAACGQDDLLVVGSRGRSALAGAVAGSVSRACVHAAPCPVVIVRALPPAGGPVVVGVDSSEHARRALRVGAEEAGLRGVPLRAAHAVHWDPLGEELLVPSTEELVAWGRQLVATELERTGVRADVAVEPGHAAETLARMSADASLLVVGSRGRNPLVGLLLGSTSDWVAGHAPCPVLVVR